MFDDSMVSYKFTIEPEHAEVCGNVCVSGDADCDRHVEGVIFERLAEDNGWAWCIIRVTATYDDVDCVVGTNRLGKCSYADEEEFRAPGGYFDDMKTAAREDLYTQLESILARFGCIDPHKYPECTD